MVVSMPASVYQDNHENREPAQAASSFPPHPQESWRRETSMNALHVPPMCHTTLNRPGSADSDELARAQTAKKQDFSGPVTMQLFSDYV
jgi:hypothetical protein